MKLWAVTAAVFEEFYYEAQSAMEKFLLCNCC